MKLARLVVTILIVPMLVVPALARGHEDGHGLAADEGVAEAIALIEVWLDAEMAHDRIPGIAAGLVHDQDLIWKKGFGVADRDTGRPVTTDTLFSICSISKLFTSVAVMQQRDAGNLRLDDPIGDHLSWFDIGDTYPDAPPVTLRGILTHSSGLPRESDYPYWTAKGFPFPTREQVMDRVDEQEELYPAFTYYQYSNLGLTLAGEVASAVAGTPYADYVRAEILDPLGMVDTYSEIPAGHERLATGYGVLGRDGVREQVPVFQARGIAPAAGYASTVEDLARFASWQFRVLGGGAPEILAANTLREMQRVHWVDPDFGAHRGLGFSTWRANDMTFVGHGGSCPGFRSHLSLQTKDKMATVAMANAMVNPSLYTSRIHEIAAPRILAAAEKAEKAAKTVEGEAQDDGPDLDRYLGLYASFWGEEAVVTWEGGLAVLGLPTEDPLGDLTRLKHIEGDIFRRVRDDDDLGEEIRFDVDEDGNVLRMWQHSNPAEKVR